MKYQHDQLKMALSQHQASLLRQLPAEGDLAAHQTFSPRFERKMGRLIRQARRQEQRQTRPAGAEKTKALHRRLLAAAIIAAILASLFSAAGAREVVVKFIVEVFDTFTSVIFRKDQPPSATRGQGEMTVPDDLHALLPARIPDGYALTHLLQTGKLLHAEYSDQANNKLNFTAQVIETTQLILDTEGTVLEELSINGHEAFFYSNKGMHSLVWQQNGLAFYLSGILDKEILMAIAESVNQGTD